jgi:hypothetical protein
VHRLRVTSHPYRILFKSIIPPAQILKNRIIIIPVDGQRDDPLPDAGQDYGVDQLESLQGADTIGYRSTLPAYRVNKTIQQGRMFEA